MPRRTPAGDAITNVVLQVLRLNGLIHRAGNAITKPAGQTGARWQVIGSIDDEPRTVAEIARRMGLARQGVQRIADVLVEEGIANFHENPVHQRAKLLGLTASGRKKLEAIQAGQRIWANRIGSEVGEKSLKQLSVLLEQLLCVFERDSLSREDS